MVWHIIWFLHIIFNVLIQNSLGFKIENVPLMSECL